MINPWLKISLFIIQCFKGKGTMSLSWIELSGTILMLMDTRNSISMPLISFQQWN